MSYTLGPSKNTFSKKTSKTSVQEKPRKPPGRALLKRLDQGFVRCFLEIPGFAFQTPRQYIETRLANSEKPPYEKPPKHRNHSEKPPIPSSPLPPSSPHPASFVFQSPLPSVEPLPSVRSLPRGGESGWASGVKS